MVRILEYRIQPLNSFGVKVLNSFLYYPEAPFGPQSSGLLGGSDHRIGTAQQHQATLQGFLAARVTHRDGAHRAPEISWFQFGPL